MLNAIEGFPVRVRLAAVHQKTVNGVASVERVAAVVELEVEQ
jgi:hypothetical protein